MSLEQFRISPTNPNEETGGNGCVCSPDQAATGCEPPFVVFHNASADTPASPNVVACANCIKAAARDLGAHSPVVETGLVLTADQVEVAWEDLPVEEQNQLWADFPQGGLVSTQFGPVVVPPNSGVDPEPITYDGEPIVETIAQKRLEEPGEHAGQFLPTSPDEEVVDLG